MAVQAIILRVLDGRAPERGARVALSEIELKDYEGLFATRTIYVGTRGEAPAGTLYETLLGTSFGDLPGEIREMHRLPGTARGRAQVERGRNPLGRLAARLFGFSAASADTPVSVRFDIDGQQETWTRTFGGRSFQSRQFAGTGRSTHLLCEAFGPLVFAMALVVEGRSLRLVLRRWSAFGIPMPLWMAPRSNSFETVAEGKFRFHVEISHPLLGLIVRYRGWLLPDTLPLPPETEPV